MRNFGQEIRFVFKTLLGRVAGVTLPLINSDDDKKFVQNFLPSSNSIELARIVIYYLNMLMGMKDAQSVLSNSILFTLSWMIIEV